MNKVYPSIMENDCMEFIIENKDNNILSEFKLIIKVKKNIKKILSKIINKFKLQYKFNNKNIYETRFGEKISILQNLILCKFIKSKIIIKPKKIIIPLFYYNKYHYFSHSDLSILLYCNDSINKNEIINKIKIKYNSIKYNTYIWRHIKNYRFVDYGYGKLYVYHYDDIIFLYIKKHKLFKFPKITSIELFFTNKKIIIEKKNIIKIKLNNVIIYFISIYISLKILKFLIKKNKDIPNFLGDMDIEYGYDFKKINIICHPEIFNYKHKLIHITQSN